MPNTLSGQSYVIIDPARLAAFMRDGNGPVLRRMLVDAEKVKGEAKRLVGKDSHNLEHRIVTRVGEIAGQPCAFVGVVNVPYAFWHHEGTRPHIIRARRARVLAFKWAKLGRRRGKGGKFVAAVAFFKVVHHPGTKPNRFLVNALRILSNNA